MTEASENKKWAALCLKKGVALAPYIIRLLLLICCIAMITSGLKLFATSGQELDALIESGDLPACIKNYVLSISAVFAAVIILLVKVRRR